MDDRRALVAAIIANPDEDTPRLVFADWLQEHGDKHDQARAEFIRLQVQAKTPTENEGGETKPDKHLAALHKKHVRHWLGPLWPLTSHDRDREFTRGLLDWWYATAGNFLKPAHQAAVCEQFPILGVKLLALTENTKRVKLVADSPALAWVTDLHWFYANIENDGFRALAESPHTSRLTRLTIDKPWCSDAGLKAFAKSKSYPNLRAFGLRDGAWRGKFSDAGIRQVLKSDRFPRLDELDLSGAHGLSVGRRSLFACEALSRLRTLRVGFDSNLELLTACPHLTNLEVLEVGNSTLSDSDALTLVNSPVFARLRTVSLYDVNNSHPPLGVKAEEALRERFGDGLSLKYSVLCRRE